MHTAYGCEIHKGIFAKIKIVVCTTWAPKGTGSAHCCPQNGMRVFAMVADPSALF